MHNNAFGICRWLKIVHLAWRTEEKGVVAYLVGFEVYKVVAAATHEPDNLVKSVYVWAIGFFTPAAKEVGHAQQFELQRLLRCIV